MSPELTAFLMVFVFVGVPILAAALALLGAVGVGLVAIELLVGSPNRAVTGLGWRLGFSTLIALTVFVGVRYGVDAIGPLALFFVGPGLIAWATIIKHGWAQIVLLCLGILLAVGAGVFEFNSYGRFSDHSTHDYQRLAATVRVAMSTLLAALSLFTSKSILARTRLSTGRAATQGTGTSV